MAIFPHFSIDFVPISLQSTTLSKETKGQGIVQENFNPGQGIIFGDLTPGQGSFLDFPAARPCMLVGQVAPSPRELIHVIVIFQYLIKRRTIFLRHPECKLKLNEWKHNQTLVIFQRPKFFYLFMYFAIFFTIL